MLSHRVTLIKPSPTLAITAKANAMKAEGIDVVGFGAGEPDMDTPDHIKAAAIDAIRAGFTKYTPTGGIPDLKQAIIAKLKRDSGIEYKPTEILVTVGGKHAFYNLAQSLFQEGDEVIIPAPYWVSYPPMVTLADATPVILESNEKAGFKITPDQVRRAVTTRTKAIVICSPSNPTGAGYTKEELARLGEVIVEKDIFVLSDEIYEKIVYDGFESVSIASLTPELKRRTFVLNAVSKTYSMTGWRIGYAAGNAEVIAAMNRVQDQSTSNPTSIAQKAAVAALNGPQECVSSMVVEFEKRRKVIVDGLNGIEGISCYRPQGAFYVFPNVSALYGRMYEGKPITGSNALTEYLLDTARVAVVPGEGFGADDYIRLSYATSMENIEKGLKRIAEAVKRLS
ncbi:MAG: aspartate aminotransferase [Deltaproteobacteria bacterium RBG_13_65_10]|nr:MAG: aspartate aminotransferase [Deltaproteobacteria bacterium RBG_13_65_10]